MSSSVQHFTESSQAQDRRISQRIFPKTLIYVACGESNGGMVLNVSDDGLAVSMAIAVSDEAYSHLNVRMNGLPQSIEVSGRMVWTTKSKKRAGIQLLDVSDTQRAQIRDWIALEGIRDVNLLPRAVADDVAPARVISADTINPVLFAEPRSTLLDAFGGTPPETLGPPLPELFASAEAGAAAPPPTAPPQAQGFDDVRTAAFRENEWDLASVTMVPRKKPQPEGLSAFALILLWIAIPSLGIGILVGRRPLEQWLSRGDAGAKTLAVTTTRPASTSPDSLASAHQADLDFSQEISSNLPINTRPFENDILIAKPIENYRSGTSSAAVDARLLNSMSTQEARAYKNIGAYKASVAKSPAVAGLDTKPNLVASSSLPSQITPPKSPQIQSVAVPSVASSSAGPGNAVAAKNNAAAPSRTQVSNAAAPPQTLPNSNSTISKPAPIPDAPKEMNTSMAHHETVTVPSTTVAAPVNATTPTRAATSSPDSGVHGNPLPSNATKSSPATLSSSTPASPGASTASPLNPSVSPSIAPNPAPKLAPPSAQPQLHGVMNIARSTDQAFILKLPAESIPGGQSASLRMQRFVMVPQRGGLFHHHSAVAKLKVGELLTQVSPEKADSKVQPHTGDTVTVRAFVDKDGAVRELKPVSGRFALMPRVMRTVREWQFDQTLVDGKPVDSEVNVTVEYHGSN